MPFTFSHPAIVLPLTFLPRKWYSFTGLVIGSLVPDFEYFLRMRIQSDYSHTFLGLFCFDLPLGIILAFVFHNLVRDSLIENLPYSFKSRLVKYKSLRWNKYFRTNWLVVITSILIGAISHLFWDSFTHDNGYFVQIMPILKDTISWNGMQISNLKTLQHSSSLFGGIVLLFAIFKLPSDNNITTKLNIKYWIAFTFLTFAITALRLLCGLDYSLYGHVIVSAIAAGLIALVLTPSIIRDK